MTNYLSIDYGEKNIGLAFRIGDDPIVPSLILANTSEQSSLEQISNFCLEKNIEEIVIGLPLTLSGEIGPQAKVVQEFGAKLAQILNIPLHYSDERFSSKLFDKMGAIDNLSAAEILQSYISRNKNQ